MTISTSDLHDAQPQTVAVCDAQFRSFGKRESFAGPCFTIRVDGDHHKVKEVVALPGEGRVLVVDGGASLRIGLMGDNLAETAMRNGWAGAVIFGAIRDSRVIDTLDFGVKALGTTARRSEVDRGGVTGQPVEIGGVTFRPGSWVYADCDAVIVSPQRLPNS